MNWDDFGKWSAALCVWREARGEGEEGMRAVLHVILNRSRKYNKTVAEVVWKKWQFSSMTAPGDSQLVLAPAPSDSAFSFIMKLTDTILTDLDLTQGATHYFNPNVVLPDWAAGMKKICSIGNHDFYKEA